MDFFKQLSVILKPLNNSQILLRIISKLHISQMLNVLYIHLRCHSTAMISNFLKISLKELKDLMRKTDGKILWSTLVLIMLQLLLLEADTSYSIHILNRACLCSPA